MSERLPCPRCGVPMNPHARKVDWSDEEPGADPAFDGVLKEFHLCPRCGASAVTDAR